MANEKDLVGVVAKKADLVKPVTFRRRRWEIADEKTGEKVVGEYLVCTCVFAGETLRFKVDDKDGKMIRTLLRMYGYPLYDLDNETVVPEEVCTEL